MIRILVRQDPLLRPVYLKWTMLTLATYTMWLGIMAMRLHGDFLGLPWIPTTTIWIIPAVFLVYGPTDRRAREFALTLPLPARTVWRAHATALLLTTGGLLMAVLVFLTLSVLGLRSQIGPLLRPDVALAPPLLNMWAQSAAWWLLLAAAVLSDRPTVAEVPRDRQWYTRQFVRLILAYLGLVVFGTFGIATVVAPLAAAIYLLVRTDRRMPETMTLVGREPASAQSTAAPAPLTAMAPGWRRRPAWLSVIQATSKHPALLLVAAVMLTLLGVTFSRWTTFSDGGEHLGVFMIPMISYCLFALTATPLLKLGIFGHLPLSRSSILAYLLVPQLVFLSLGFVTGELLVLRGAPRTELVTWSNEADTYGLRMAPRYFAVSWGDPPVSVGPDGTRSTPPNQWRPLGPHGPVLYKPFHVPADASLAFSAWQFERAIQHVYGQTVPAAELADRFLAGSPDGPVVWRSDAPPLREVYPDLAPRRFAGLLPIQILLAGTLFQAAILVYLSRFRPGVSDRARKVTFVSLLAVLMALYLAPFFLSLGKAGDPAGLNFLILAVSEWLATATPGGASGMWLVTIAALGAGQALVLRQFRRAEWPPVREGDGFCEVLG